MWYWRKNLMVIPAAATLMLAAGPALAQSSASSNKPDQQQAANYQDVLTGALPPNFMGTNIRGTVAAIVDASLPTVPARMSPQEAQAAFSALIMQGISGGLGQIQAEVNSEPPPPPPSPAASMAAAADALIATIEERVALLQQQQRAAVLAAAQAAGSGGAANDPTPSPSSSAPPIPPPGFTAPPANNGEAAMVAALVNSPDVVAVVRDQAVTTALKGWEDTFSAAWPDYAENKIYYPDFPDFIGRFHGDALAVMPDGSTSKGSLFLKVGYYGGDGTMTFASANPNLAGTVEFYNWAMRSSPSGTIMDGPAFGGTLGDGTWSTEFYGSVGDIVAGNWSATISGGPNAGTVVGKFGGSQ